MSKIVEKFSSLICVVQLIRFSIELWILLSSRYSYKNTRQIHIFFNQAKIWQPILCWFTMYFVTFPNLKLFCNPKQKRFHICNDFTFVICTKYVYQQRISPQILDRLKKLCHFLIGSDQLACFFFSFLYNKIQYGFFRSFLDFIDLCKTNI